MTVNPSNMLKSIYFTVFESQLNYESTTWGQSIFTIKMMFLLQKEALRARHFKEHKADTL